LFYEILLLYENFLMTFEIPLSYWSYGSYGCFFETLLIFETLLPYGSYGFFLMILEPYVPFIIIKKMNYELS
jgi:hypothetical protein